ncbi:DUF4272 domain-containing protein [Photobacterium damselae]|uniref:DUF4272 domain-containing protein n=2 Tax=Photobacterium damselae TaxID=38293 RepID=D0Z467_PHODD|nr:DUF4272 domain-containing protein [Photobacterium damselae]EEZ39305.1 hypothetical protein VDA_000323 [Photobacterium damselae subsp. damselae CIP 102761]PSW79990.1 DUF4272 domain-containing protein [Photobacterium damselae]SPY44395.1 Uncharacterised protein [Photobacterium damselae]
MDLQKIRKKSLSSAEKLGYEINTILPLFDDGIKLRPQEEIVGRSLALFAVVACSYGFDKPSAIQWMVREGVIDYLSDSERSFLNDGEGDISFFQSQVEGLNAFAWALGFVKSIPFDSTCDNTLIKRFPDIKNDKSSSEYKTQSAVRSIAQIISACDLAYCLHWAIVNAEVNIQDLHGDVGRHVISERRRALEWILCTDDWDEISLDT